MTAAPGQGSLASVARGHDPDRFLTALFAPAGKREQLFTLIAFNHELARALDIAAGSRGDYGGIGGRIRLQWWREVVEGERKAHEIATPLTAMLEAGAVDRGTLLSIIDAREAELGGFEDTASWQAALQAGPGGLAVAIAQVLGLPSEPFGRIAAVGAAYAVGKILRHRPTLEAIGRYPMPAGLRPAAAVELASAHLRSVPPLPRAQRSATLLSVLARRDLARAAAGRHQDHPRGAADRFAVALAALTGATV